VTEALVTESFTPLFDRAALACVQAERLILRSTAAVARARATFASTRRVRSLVHETRDYWADADSAFAVLQRQVELVAIDFRNAGMAARDSAARVRQRVRFILYDGGFREVEVEPVVDRATAWVDAVFMAA
jgi:hypothetical protein